MIPRPVSAALALAAAALAAACAQPSPGERASALRAGYTAELNGFIVREEPIAVPEAVPVEEAAAGAPEAAPEDAAAPAVRQDVLLDVLVRNDNRDGRLPGLTLDVEQADARREVVKTSYRIYVDTSAIAPGTERAVSHTLRDVDYAPGDGFAVEVRQAIPAEMVDQYRELAEAGEPS